MQIKLSDHFTYRRLFRFVIPSVIMMIFAVGVGIYAFATFFGGGNPIDGWTSTMLFLSAGFFGIFVLLGIILKYLSVVVDLVFNKQKYFVESVEKVNNRR